ncbi:hypothetical protein [Micromonospora sp. NPDC005173]|uniref:hypothetical protein n=1 Tax=Micromonospora sp. NPDC005173 TaxID=3157165 RepID=UPI00339F3CD3
MTDRDTAVRAVYKSVRIAGQLTYYRNRVDEYTRANQQAIIVRNTLLGLAPWRERSVSSRTEAAGPQPAWLLLCWLPSRVR